MTQPTPEMVERKAKRILQKHAQSPLGRVMHMCVDDALQAVKEALRTAAPTASHDDREPDELDAGIEAILAKDDTQIMLDWLRELFGADIDCDSRFTTAQILTAMDSAFERGKEHIQMVHRAEAAARDREPERCPTCNRQDPLLNEFCRDPFHASAWDDREPDETSDTECLLIDRIAALRKRVGELEGDALAVIGAIGCVGTKGLEESDRVKISLRVSTIRKAERLLERAALNDEGQQDEGQQP